MFSIYSLMYKLLSIVGQFKQLQLHYVIDNLPHASGFVLNAMGTFGTIVSSTH